VEWMMANESKGGGRFQTRDNILLAVGPSV
jgi:hypothetical protein